jgi:hypothetical protein
VPWGNPVEIYRPPELDAPRPFNYSAIAHPELQSPAPTDLVVTYATNSSKFVGLLTEYDRKHLHWPRVMTVKVSNQR